MQTCHEKTGQTCLTDFLTFGVSRVHLSLGGYRTSTMGCRSSEGATILTLGILNRIQKNPANCSYVNSTSEQLTL